MDIKKYGRNLVRAFYDAQLYKEAIEQWEGFGGRHIMFVGVVIGLLLTILLGISVQLFARSELPYLLEQMPRIEMKNHELQVQDPQPRTVKTKDGNFRLIIDTKADDVELFGKTAEMVVGKKLLLLKQVDGTFKPVFFQKVKDFVLTKQDIQDFFDRGIYFVLIAAWPLSAVGQALSLLVQAFLVAVLSYAVTAAMKEEYYFSTRMRIAALAMTPPFVIAQVTSLMVDTSLQAPVAKMWFALLLGLLYFYVMIVLIRRLDGSAKPQA